MNGLSHIRLALLAGAAGCLLTSALPVMAQAAPAAPAPQHPAEPPKWPDFNTVVKDMTPMPGLMTLYRYKSDDASKDQTKIYCQIPRALMKQDLLLATSISRGPQAGFQWDDYLVRFEMQGKEVIITVPDARFVTNPAQPVNDVVSRTYNDSFLSALPIATFAPNGDPVVEIGGALLTPIVNLPAPGGGFAPRRDMSSFPKVKVFPDNVLTLPWRGAVVRGRRWASPTISAACRLWVHFSRASPMNAWVTSRPFARTGRSSTRKRKTSSVTSIAGT
jgi:hypothetical protein